MATANFHDHPVDNTASVSDNKPEVKIADIDESMNPGLSIPAPPPNGGLMAWLQVAAGFVLFFNTWGMISAFSVYQTYYESGDLFQASSSNISWIGSIQSFLLQLTGLVAGPVYDRGQVRLLIGTGSFLIVFG